MKKYFLISSMLFGLASKNMWSQPIGYNTPLATNATNVITTANAAWYRGGNQNTGNAGNTNIFGTKWNSGIFTITDNQYRIRLNESTNYQIGVLAMTSPNTKAEFY